MNIEIVEPKLYSGVVADEIAALLSEAVAERGSASLVLAGGSTPASVYRALGLPPRVDAIPWRSLRVYLGDERWVPSDDALSNYRMATETLFSKLGDPNVKNSDAPKVFPVDTTLPSPLEGCRAYEQVIRQAEGTSSGALPVFDLVLLGLGTDGHTASLFPHGAVQGGSVVGVATHPTEVGKPGGSRITLTSEALKNARRLMFLVTGDNKASMLKRVIEGTESEEVLPARLFASARGGVSWFVDSAAAQQLSASIG